VNDLRLRVIMSAVALAGLAACAPPGGSLGAGAVAADSAIANVVDLANNRAGTVRFSNTASGLLIRGTVSGLGIGSHAVHIHQVGQCRTPAFATAGEHFDRGSHTHGFKSANGPHAGDLPNIVTPGAGAYSFEMVASGLTIARLLDADGAAIVFHSAADDYLTDPSGNSGARIACGVIARQS
jgi:Cu-Zn family superoxide dismutase